MRKRSPDRCRAATTWALLALLACTANVWAQAAGTAIAQETHAAKVITGQALAEFLGPRPPNHKKSSDKPALDAAPVIDAPSGKSTPVKKTTNRGKRLPPKDSL
jgi:hypothetical protein